MVDVDVHACHCSDEDFGGEAGGVVSEDGEWGTPSGGNRVDCADGVLGRGGGDVLDVDESSVDVDGEEEEVRGTSTVWVVPVDGKVVDGPGLSCGSDRGKV